MKIKLRPKVVAFAYMMEKQLSNNDHKVGWKNSSLEYLSKKLAKKSFDLFQTSDLSSKDLNIKKDVMPLAADVANYAMMIADNFGGLAPYKCDDFNPVFLVAVSHFYKEVLSKNYWFQADEQLAENLKIDDWVLVDTCYGPATGRVMLDPIMVTRQQDLINLRIALRSIGELKSIIQKIEYNSNENELPF